MAKNLIFVRGDSSDKIKKKLENAGVPFEEKGTLLNTVFSVPSTHRSRVAQFRRQYTAVYSIPSGMTVTELQELGPLRIIDPSPSKDPIFHPKYSPEKCEVYVLGSTKIKLS